MQLVLLWAFNRGDEPKNSFPIVRQEKEDSGFRKCEWQEKSSPGFVANLFF